MGQIGAKDIGADLAFGADLALSVLQSSFVFLGELFEAVPRLNRSIPHSRVYVCCAPYVQRSLDRGDQLRCSFFKLLLIFMSPSEA